MLNHYYCSSLQIKPFLPDLGFKAVDLFNRELCLHNFIFGLSFYLKLKKLIFLHKILKET